MSWKTIPQTLGSSRARGRPKSSASRVNGYSKVTNDEVLEMLRKAGAPECRPEEAAALTRCIDFFCWLRSAAPTHKPFGTGTPIAAAALRREILKEIAWLERRHAEVARAVRAICDWEIDRRHQFLEILSAELDWPRDYEAMDKCLDPDEAHLGVMEQILCDYEKIFGRGRARFLPSRSSPALKLVALAVKRIGWYPKTPGAIELALRKTRKEYQERKPKDGVIHKFGIRILCSDSR